MASTVYTPNTWIRITPAAMAAGATAAAITYTLMSLSSSAVAVSTNVLVDAAGTVAAEGTRYFFGDIPAMTVRVFGRMFSKTSEESVRYGGTLTAVAAAAVVGGTTAITVSVGSEVLRYSIEYGGILTQAAAVQISEAYLQYKLKSSERQCEEPFQFKWSESEEWMVMEQGTEQEQKQEQEPMTPV